MGVESKIQGWVPEYIVDKLEYRQWYKRKTPCVPAEWLIEPDRKIEPSEDNKKWPNFAMARIAKKLCTSTKGESMWKLISDLELIGEYPDNYVRDKQTICAEVFFDYCKLGCIARYGWELQAKQYLHQDNLLRIKKNSDDLYEALSILKGTYWEDDPFFDEKNILNIQNADQFLNELRFVSEWVKNHHNYRVPSPRDMQLNSNAPLMWLARCALSGFRGNVKIPRKPIQTYVNIVFSGDGRDLSEDAVKRL